VPLVLLNSFVFFFFFKKKNSVWFVRIFFTRNPLKVWPLWDPFLSGNENDIEFYLYVSH
jgi:hypothetical protein